MIDRFDHLLIHPADFGRSRAFYRDTLGWAIVAEWGGDGEPRRTVFSGGAIKVVLAERPPGFDGDGRAELRLDIHDVGKRFREMEAGPHVVLPPGGGADGAPEFIVRDPDGNRIAFEEVHRARG